MIVFRKARSPNQTLNDLDAYISGLGDEPIEFVAREVKRWGEFSYDELEAAILDGRLDELIAWRERYATLINEHLSPMWASAFLFAASKATRGKTILSDSDFDVRAWLSRHGGELISRLSDESRKAIANVILHAQEKLMDYRQIARQIRPLIGLNAQQAQANFNYRLKVYRQYLDNGASESVASSRAEKAALKYAAKQQRFRAETITHTELAFAYNQGAHVGVLRAIKEKLMPKCAMVWLTAGTNRVCPRCMALKDKVVGYTDEQGVQLPPLHPRCRCVIDYREVDLTVKPTNGNVRPQRGLSAGERTIDFSSGGKSPYKIGEIEFKDATQVKQVLDWCEARIVTAPVENAIIITTTGEIYHCTGGLNDLDTIVELGEKLRGAIVTHNHPKGSVNEYTFSADDRNLFALFQLTRLRGVDEKFVYEFNRATLAVDDESTASLYPEGYAAHLRNIEIARFCKYSYRRWVR